MSNALWYDEISVTRYYLKNIFHLLEAWSHDTNMPVHYTLMFFWNKIFDDTEFFLRLPPLLFGVASIGLVYETAKRIFDRNTALLASVLMAFSAVHMWYSAEARPYSGMIFFLLLALLAFIRLTAVPEQTKIRRACWLFVYFVAAFLGTLSHFYMIIPLFVFSGLAVFRKGRNRFTLLVLNGFIIVMLGIFLFLKAGLLKEFPTGAPYLRKFTAVEAWLLFFDWYPTGNSLRMSISNRERLSAHPGLLFYQFFFFLLFVKGLIQIYRENDRERKFFGFAVFCFLIATPAYLFIVGLIGLGHTYIERSVYVGLPFFLMIISNRLIPPAGQISRAVPVAALLLLTAFSAFYLHKNSKNCVGEFCKTDYRAVAGYLSREIGERKESSVIVYQLQPRSLSYYNRDFPDHVRLERLHQRLPKILRLFEKIPFTQSRIVPAFRDEIRRNKKKLETIRNGKVAVMNFSEVRRKKKLSYRFYYAIERQSRKSATYMFLQWFRRIPGMHEPQIIRIGKAKIYKFEVHHSH